MWKWLFPVLLICRGGAALAAPPWEGLPAPVAASEARLSEVVVDLDARAAKATAALKARDRYFTGTAAFEAAFPNLVGARLDRAEVLAGRRLVLSERATDRAREAQQAPTVSGDPDAQLDGRRVARFDASRRRAHIAEEGADIREGRLLAALQARADSEPALVRAISEERDAIETAIRDAIVTPELSEADATIVQQRAAAADRALTSWQRLFAAFRDGAATAQSSYDIGPDLLSLGDSWTLRRLEVALPMLAGDERVRASEVLLKKLAAEMLPAAEEAAVAAEGRLKAEQAANTSVPLAEAEVALETAAAKREAAEQALAAMPEAPPDTMAGLRREVAALGLREAIAEEERARIVAESSKTAGLDSDAQARQAAEQSKILEEEAQRLQKLGSKQERDAGRILQALGESRKRPGITFLQLSKLDDAKILDEERESLLDGLEDAVAGLSDPVTATAFEASGQHRDWRALTETLREDLWRRMKTREQAAVAVERARSNVASDKVLISGFRASLPQVIDVTLRADIEDKLIAWEKSLQLELWAARTYLRRSEVQVDVTLHHIARARNVERGLQEHVSRAVISKDRTTHLFGDLVVEIELLGPLTATAFSDRLQAITGLIGAKETSGVVLTALASSFYSLLLLAAWWLVRRNTQGNIMNALTNAKRLGYLSLRPIELKALRDPAVRFAVATIDLVLGYSLIWTLGQALTVVGLVLLTYLQLALYRAVIAGFDLCFVAHPQQRPALRAFKPEVHALMRRTLQVVVVWFLARRFLVYLASDVLPLDTWGESVSWWLGWLFLVIAALLLHRWEPHLRKRMTRNDTSSGLVAWLASEPTWALSRSARALAALTFLALTLGWDLLNRLASERQELGRLLNVVSRYHLGASEEEVHDERHQIDAELREMIVASQCPKGAYVRREGFEEQLERELRDWGREGRRGLVALVADHGAGTRTVLDHVLPRLQAEHGCGMVRRIRLDRRISTRNGFLAWLSEVFALQTIPENQDAAIRAINDEVSPGICVIEDAHLAFVRTVGGFGALQALTYILNGASEKHFWIVDFHRPAWAYLSRLDGIVNTEVFRSVLYIQPFTESELQELTLRRLQGTEFHASFETLVRNNVFGGDPAMELERTTRTFFRLLAEASEGNPTVALDLFATALSPYSGDEAFDRKDKTQLYVHMHVDLGTTVLSDPSDADLFALVAVRTHAGLDERELVNVTNMSPGLIRSTVKHLEALTLLKKVGDEVVIVSRNLPRINRTLRRRRYIPWEV